MTVLVTGGSGFIGRAIVHALGTRGRTVRVADLRPFPDPAVPTVLGDLRQPEVLDRAVGTDLDGVIHLAALTGVVDSVHRPVEAFDTNVAVTAGLLERVRRQGIPRVLFASSNAVVGQVAAGSTLDENCALAPLTPYGATKAAAEMLLSGYGAAYGIATSVLRLSNVYGPGMGGKDSVVPRLLRAARERSIFRIYGDGSQVRDYLFIDDVVRAFLLAWDADAVGVLTVGSGVSTSLRKLLAMVEEATGNQVAVEHAPPRPGEMVAARVDPSRAQRLGLPPPTTLAEGLRLTWADAAGWPAPPALSRSGEPG